MIKEIWSEEGVCVCVRERERERERQGNVLGCHCQVPTVPPTAPHLSLARTHARFVCSLLSKSAEIDKCVINVWCVCVCVLCLSHMGSDPMSIARCQENSISVCLKRWRSLIRVAGFWTGPRCLSDRRLPPDEQGRMCAQDRWEGGTERQNTPERLYALWHKQGGGTRTRGREGDEMTGLQSKSLRSYCVDSDRTHCSNVLQREF